VDGLFGLPGDTWLTTKSLPKEPLPVCDGSLASISATTCAGPLPVLYGDTTGAVVQAQPNGLRLGIDVFGSAFFMLCRYEEIVSARRDEHGRFPAAASIAQRAGFLWRPLVNEYVEVLWACLRHVCPGLHRSAREFQVFSTHDVDRPYAYSSCGLTGLGRAAADRLVRQRSPGRALKCVTDWVDVRRHGFTHDPYYTFPDIMDTCEAENTPLVLNFIPDPDPLGRARTALYTMETPAIDALLKAVAARGHEIGLHPSYRSHMRPELLVSQLDSLKAAAARRGIDQAEWGGRSHYLRWEPTASFKLWDDAGLSYDSSMAYSESPGFRSGTCYSYPVFDVFNRRQLKLRERPLILMDMSLADLKLSPGSVAAKEVVTSLRANCKVFGGEFVILWHNNVLADPDEFALYRAALSGRT